MYWPNKRRVSVERDITFVPTTVSVYLPYHPLVAQPRLRKPPLANQSAALSSHWSRPRRLQPYPYRHRKFKFRKIQLYPLSPLRVVKKRCRNKMTTRTKSKTFWRLHHWHLSLYQGRPWLANSRAGRPRNHLVHQGTEGTERASTTITTYRAARQTRYAWRTASVPRHASRL
jgi:hypothetical protein